MSPMQQQQTNRMDEGGRGEWCDRMFVGGVEERMKSVALSIDRIEGKDNVWFGWVGGCLYTTIYNYN